MDNGSSGHIGTWKLGLGRLAERDVRQQHETSKPRSVEQCEFRLVAKLLSLASLANLRLDMEESSRAVSR